MKYEVNWKVAFVVLAFVIWFTVGFGLVINKKLNSQGAGFISVEHPSYYTGAK